MTSQSYSGCNRSEELLDGRKFNVSNLNSGQGTQGPEIIIQAIDPSLDSSVIQIAQPTEENLNQSQEEFMGSASPYSSCPDSPGYFLYNDEDMELFPGLSQLECATETRLSSENICDDAEGWMML